MADNFDIPPELLEEAMLAAQLREAEMPSNGTQETSETVRAPIESKQEQLVDTSKADDFNQYQVYFEQCLTEGKINHNQYNHLMGLFLDGTDITKTMSDMNLLEGFHNFMTEKKQLEEAEKERQLRIQQDLAHQKAVLQDMIRDGTIELQKFEAILGEMTQTLETIRAQYDSQQNRIDAYQAYDNPKLMGELAQIQERMDAEQGTLMQAQEDYQKKQAEVQGWADQLAQLG